MVPGIRFFADLRIFDILFLLVGRSVSAFLVVGCHDLHCAFCLLG